MKHIIKTAIIEKQREWREKFVNLINFTPGFACIGNYGTLKDALENFATKSPDIVLCNFHFMDDKEKEFVAMIRRKYPKLPILIFNFYEDEESLFDLPQHKNDACLFKVTMPVKFLKTLTKNSLMKLPIFDFLAADSNDSPDDFKFRRPIGCDLTPHEKRLLKLIVEGHNYKTAAGVLKVSYNTVKFHMRRVYQKLEVNSKSAAVAKALRLRLIS